MNLSVPCDTLKELHSCAILSQHAYADDWAPQHLSEGCGAVSYSCFEGTQSGGYLHALRKGGVISLAFRGTTPLDWRDWLTNAKGWADEWEQIRGALHSGFVDSYMELRPQLLTWLRTQSAPLGAIRICGHSNGGALARLCAHDLSLQGHQVFGAVFGTPAQFSRKAARWYAGELFSVARYLDWVPVVAKTVGWKQAGVALFIGENGEPQFDIGGAVSHAAWFRLHRQGLFTFKPHAIAEYVKDIGKALEFCQGRP